MYATEKMDPGYAADERRNVPTPRPVCLMECAKQAEENAAHLEKIAFGVFDLLQKLSAVVSGTPGNKPASLNADSGGTSGLMPLLMKQSALIDQIGTAVGEISSRVG